MLTKPIAERPVSEPLCPCGKANRSDMERIPRGRLVKTFLFWLPLRKYKCYRCSRNKWVLK